MLTTESAPCFIQPRYSPACRSHCLLKSSWSYFNGYKWYIKSYISCAGFDEITARLFLFKATSHFTSKNIWWVLRRKQTVEWKAIFTLTALAFAQFIRLLSLQMWRRCLVKVRSSWNSCNDCWSRRAERCVHADMYIRNMQTCSFVDLMQNTQTFTGINVYHFTTQPLLMI